MSKRYLRSITTAVHEMEAQVYDAGSALAVIVAEEYARAAFQFFVSALPIATGLLQHSAKARIVGNAGSTVKSRVLQNTRGSDAPIMGWDGNHWRTRVAYQSPDNPRSCLIQLDVAQAFKRKSDGIFKNQGNFKLEFTAGRSVFAEPEFRQFLTWVNTRREMQGKPVRQYGDRDVAEIHAHLILERNGSMRGHLELLLDRAKRAIRKRQRIMLQKQGKK